MVAAVVEFDAGAGGAVRIIEDVSTCEGKQRPRRLLGIEWAPLRIPWGRRIQTLGVVVWMACFGCMGFGCMFLSLYLFFTSYWWIVALYAIWYVYDFQTPQLGGHPHRPWARGLAVWRWARDYFPVSLRRTAYLDPTRNYILGYHPHGVFATGAFMNFATDATDFRGQFPGLRSHLLVLSGQFYFPFFREAFMMTGACSCSAASISHLLSTPGGGRALVLIVGGAAEVLDARPGPVRIQATRRKGFCRLALQHGTSLVPVFSFGENDAYNQMANAADSWLGCAQERLRRVCGFSMPLVRGRGVFNYTVGLLPHRVPISTVVGAPITVPLVETPSSEQVEELRQRYFTALEELYEAHKQDYGIPLEQKLQFV